MSESVTVTSLGGGAYHIARPGGSTALAFGVRDGSKIWVFADGQTYVVQSVSARRATSHRDAVELAAPMPATVAQVHVAPGQRVKSGDLLITLEAMKMELPIRAASDGTVKSIKCRAGEMVLPGLPLLELDEPGRTP